MFSCAKKKCQLIIPLDRPRHPSSRPQGAMDQKTAGWSEGPISRKRRSRGCRLAPVALALVFSTRFPPNVSGYLMRPLLLTAPSSDLGSGDEALQLVLAQGGTLGQRDVRVEHTSPVTQKAPTKLSTQPSRALPTKDAFFWDSSRAGSMGGSFRTRASCWKPCSR